MCRDMKCVFSGKVTVLKEGGGRRRDELEVFSCSRGDQSTGGGQERRKGVFRQLLSSSVR